MVRLQLATKWQTALELTLVDALGRTLKTQSVSASESKGEITVDMSNFSTGTYFLILQSGDKTASFKVVKED